MSLSLGLVGLPNAGKSTLFNALTRGGAQVGTYPFTTINPNVGVVQVPDERLRTIADLVRPERVVPATIQFVDIAGLVRGSSEGEGLGNQFLGHIRDVDAVLFVIRCFEDPDITHIYGETDPARDIGILDVELILADLATVDRRLEKARTAAKSGDKRQLKEVELLESLRDHLNQSRPARTYEPPVSDADVFQGMGLPKGLLTGKPVLYVANVDEDDLASALEIASRREGQGLVQQQGPVEQMKRIAQGEGAELVAVSAKLEAELADLAPEDAAAYLDSLGVAESGLERLVKASYRLLEIISFFTTTGGKEVRAWTVSSGTKAPQAAGKIHSDMERGFIRAEVVAFRDLVEAGSMLAARDRGLVRVEGRDYTVQDGDVVHFRFNV